MLYEYNKDKKQIKMLPSHGAKELGCSEKDLENLLAENLSDLYNADGQLMLLC